MGGALSNAGGANPPNGEVDLAFLDSQKNQHKQNLKQILHYYQNFEKNHREIAEKLQT